MMSEDIEKIIDEFSTYVVHDCGKTYLFLIDGKASIKQPLYHYTTMDAFLNIMNKREFWVSNIRYMNDSKEFENGREICKLLINERIQNSTEEEKEFLSKLQDSCQLDSSGGLRNINANDIFSLSFCKEGDLLTQWQVYGKNGISIGFNNDMSFLNGICLMNEDQYSSETETHEYPHAETRLGTGFNVIYNDDKKKYVINKVLDTGINRLKLLEKVGGLEVVNEISDELFSIFPYMKEYCFSHENEYRLLFKEPVSKKWIHYRIRNGVIVPYIKMKILDLNCREHTKLPIGDIVIAPGVNNTYVADSVKYFLEKSGYEYLVDKVRTSKIPYRA